MPVEFDEAWEYWEPDPEIAEVMGTYAPAGFDCLGVEEFRTTQYRGLTGFRFGRGRSSFRWVPTRTARPKPVNLTPMKRGPQRTLPDQTCPTCRGAFRPRESRDVYCSKVCSPKTCGGGRESPVDKSEVVRLFDGGKAVTGVAEEVGITVTYCQAILRKAGRKYPDGRKGRGKK